MTKIGFVGAGKIGSTSAYATLSMVDADELVLIDIPPAKDLVEGAPKPVREGISKADAEDITHHVFMNSWENIGSFRFQGFPFSSWLYRLAHNAVIDFYRTRKNTVDIESVIETEAADIPIDGDVLDTRYEAEKVHTALKTLKPDEQSVVIMKFINELSNAEVSVALEKSEGAIRVIQHRALKNLKKQLEQQTK